MLPLLLLYTVGWTDDALWIRRDDVMYRCTPRGADALR